MRLDDRQRDQVMQTLLEYMERVKSEVLQEKRSEDDYPVGIGPVLKRLSAGFKELAAESPGSSEEASRREIRSQTPLASFLKSDRWDHNKVGRKRFKNGPSYSYKFFLPGDDHFVEWPRSEKEYVRLLFRLERRGVYRVTEPDESRRSDSSENRESFEADVTGTYRRLIGKTRGAAYIRVPELRKEMQVEKESFDKGLLAMRDQGKVILSKHGYAASLSAEDREGAIEVSPGEFYYYMSLREGR